MPSPFRRPAAPLVAACVALFCFSLLSGKNKYEKWLEEDVVWIISKAEKEKFEGLEDDDARDRFIEEFWRRRDPTPSTERNEYKEEHYRRFMFANQMFREGIPGWKTDRGRVYILHGQPDSEGFYNSRSQISPNRELHSTTRSPNTILWNYHQNPTARYYRGEIRIVFQPSSGMTRQNFVLSESKTAQDRAEQFSKQFFPATNSNWFEADVRYRLVMAGPPAVINAKGAELPNSGYGEFTKYVEDLFRSPGELLEELEAKRRRREGLRQEARQVDANVAFQQFEIVLSSQAFWRGANQWWLPLHISAELEEVDPEELDVYAALLDERGEVFDEFLDTINLQIDDGASGQASVRYANAFSVPSGQYRLRAVLRGAKSQRMGFHEIPIVLDEETPAKLKLGAVLVTNRVQAMPESPSPESADFGEGIVFNEARLLPNRSGRFAEGGYLFLYLQLWFPANGERAMVNVKFIRDGQMVRRSAPRMIDKPESDPAEYGSVFSLEGLDPGYYTVQIQAVDQASKTWDIRRFSFRIG